MYYKQNNKENKSFVQGLRPFGNTLPRSIKSILKRNGYNYSEIISKWSMLVGDEISKYSYPKSIKMNEKNGNGILLLAVKRGDEINVEYSKEDIINKINSYFGYKLISEVRLETYNSQLKKNNEKNKKKFSQHLENKIKEIKNENLKNSIMKLLSAAKK